MTNQAVCERKKDYSKSNMRAPLNFWIKNMMTGIVSIDWVISVPYWV